MKLKGFLGRKDRSEKPLPPPERRGPTLREDGIAENIFIGPHNVALVRRLCATGRYVGPTDVFVTALRMLEEHEEVREARNPSLSRPALPSPSTSPQGGRGRK